MVKWKNLYYETIGDGSKNIIFLHGYGGSHHSFEALANYLDKCFKSYLLDLPGFGDSKLEKSFTLDDYVTCINDFIVENRINKPLIIGHSFGGRIALKMTEEYQYKIILISTPIYDYRSIRIKIRLILNKLFKISRPSNDYKNASIIMKATLNNIFKDMKKINFKKINGKQVLIIYANKDKVVPSKVAFYGKRKMKGSGLIKINGNHFAYLNEPILLSKVILSYA